jgi:large subunit ribosomal protein L17
MRHLKHRHTLGVTSSHRLAMIANMASSLIEHGRIQTTLTKAKALRPFIEKIITLAKKAQSAQPERAIYLRKLAFARLRNQKAVRLLFNEKVNEFLNRPGGYSRIYKIGTRTGDAAEMALIELIQASDEGYKTSSQKGRTKKKKASATTSAVPSTEEKEEPVVKEPEAEKPIAEEKKPKVAKKKSVTDDKPAKNTTAKKSVKGDAESADAKKKKTKAVTKKASVAKKAAPKKKKS